MKPSTIQRDAQYRRQFPHLFRYAKDSNKDSDQDLRWITLGGKEEDDKKHKGGFPVQIKGNGEIVNSRVGGLQGKNVSEVKGHFDQQKDKKAPPKPAPKKPKPEAKPGEAKPVRRNRPLTYPYPGGERTVKSYQEYKGYKIARPFRTTFEVIGDNGEIHDYASSLQKAVEQIDARVEPSNSPKEGKRKTSNSSPAKLERSLLDGFKSLKRKNARGRNQVTIPDLKNWVRENMGEVDNNKLNKAIQMLYKHNLRPISISNAQHATREQLDDAIPGLNETLFFLEEQK